MHLNAISMKDNNEAYIYAEHLEYGSQKICTLFDT